MFNILIPLQTSSQVVDVLNILGAALVLGYIVAHRQQKQVQNANMKQTWRKRATGLLFGFLLYALVISTFGPRETWVATVGSTIDTNIRQFSEGLAVVGQQTEATSSTERVLGSMKTLGLVVYIILFGTISISTAAARRVHQFMTNII